MLVEFVTTKIVKTEEKVEIELPILEKIAFLHYKYSGGYNYFIKFIPSMYEINDKKIYTLDYIYMREEKIIKGQIKISPFDFRPSLNYNSKNHEFDYIGENKTYHKIIYQLLLHIGFYKKDVQIAFLE
jgi:hypothetical protein